jgi:hypothetical protein
MSTITMEPVRRTIGVDCDVEHAWEVFTRRIASWWPTSSHSLAGDQVADVVFEGREGGDVYEVSTSGERHLWATVQVWDPPNRLVLDWKVNPERPVTEVEVIFTPFEDGSGTRVELEHRGWSGDDRESRDNYDEGWEFVLGRFAESIAKKA